MKADIVLEDVEPALVQDPPLKRADVVLQDLLRAAKAHSDTNSTSSEFTARPEASPRKKVKHRKGTTKGLATRCFFNLGKQDM